MSDLRVGLSPRAPPPAGRCTSWKEELCLFQMLHECNSQPEWSPGHEKGMAKKRDAQPEDNVLALETFVINTDLIPIKKN